MSSIATPPPALRAEAKVIGLVSLAHLMSHFFALAVPPVFFLLKEEFGVSYAALGFATTMFFVASGFLQTPAGFLVDRLGGRAVLASGLALSSLGILLVGFVPSYPLLVAALMIAGMGNSVFHPADMAILNARITAGKLGYAFSVHGMSGNLGWVIAPLFSVALASAFGWRAAMIAAGAIGFAVTLLIALHPLLRHPARIRPPRQRGALGDDVRLLISAPVLSCFFFFVFSSVSSTAMQTFSIPAMVGLYGVPWAAAAGTLTGYLAGAAAGTLTGGFVAAHTRRHDVVAVAGIAGAVLFILALASGAVPGALLVLTTTLAGFCLGSVNPSRDIIVREVTPEHARGKVYGFVYSGLDLGSSIAPPAIGWLIDTGQSRLVFLTGATALLMAAAIMAMLGRRARI
ncbi:MAG: MFS transporter [Betaproteobacteria bacterium]|nr:MFS transporter [Betaproteobacteria bacterium]